MVLDPDDLDRRIEVIWQELYREQMEGLLANESDMQASLYGKLRDYLDPVDYLVRSEHRIPAPNGGRYKADLVVLKPDQQLWSVIEIKGIWKGKVGAATRDISKMRDYKLLGAERGYFCFTTNDSNLDALTRVLCPTHEWAKGFLRVAEGFDQDIGRRRSAERTNQSRPWRVIRL